jgi:membrane protein
MRMKSMWSMLKATVREFNEDRVLRLAAALGYYAIFSIGPLLIIVVGVAGLIMGEESVRKEIERQLQGFMGEGATKMINSMTSARQESKSIVATIVGLVALLFGATGVFSQLQDSLNTIWEVKPKPGRGVIGFIRDRFLSFAMILGIGFLLLVSMALTTILSAMTGAVGNMMSIAGLLAQVMNFVVSFVVITLLFAAIFKVLPDVQVEWRDVWVGAIGTALLFTVGKSLLGLYLGREATASAYGAAGSVVVVLMWFYYSSLILFFGAEFTQVYAKHTGSAIVPARNAVPVTEEERAQQGMPSPERVEGVPAPSSSVAHPVPDQPFVVYTKVRARETTLPFLSFILAVGMTAGALLARSRRRTQSLRARGGHA